MKYFLFFMAGLVLLVASCNGDNSTHPQSNENIILSKGFEVCSESTDLETSVRGTVFLSGSNDKISHVQIVASVEIDPVDWAGVEFLIPRGWHVSRYTNSYPEGDKEKNPANYIELLYTGGEEVEYNQRIDIGRGDMWVPTGGGTGTIVIELDSTSAAEKSIEKFNIVVGVGSSDKSGYHSSYPDFKKIEFSAP